MSSQSLFWVRRIGSMFIVYLCLLSSVFLMWIFNDKTHLIIFLTTKKSHLLWCSLKHVVIPSHLDLNVVPTESLTRIQLLSTCLSCWASVMQTTTNRQPTLTGQESSTVFVTVWVKNRPVCHESLPLLLFHYAIKTHLWWNSRKWWAKMTSTVFINFMWLIICIIKHIMKLLFRKLELWPFKLSAIMNLWCSFYDFNVEIVNDSYVCVNSHVNRSEDCQCGDNSSNGNICSRLTNNHFFTPSCWATSNMLLSFNCVLMSDVVIQVWRCITETKLGPFI